mmetsp:Transcript_104071/g.204115  ORF Transcript_104071/g.204115 Transcript_104071/m.204115 type:complete len:595 (+) Transcript_104071:53-1837(+)
MEWAKPSEAQDKCCEKQECCDGPIAFCVACRKCQSLGSYCKAELFKAYPKAIDSLPKQPPVTVRRLSEIPGVAPEHLSGYQTPALHPIGVSPEERAEHIKFGQQVAAQTIRNLGQSPTARRPSATKRRLLALRNRDRIQTLEGMQTAAQEAASFMLQHLPNVTEIMDAAEDQRKAWVNSWNEVVLQAKESALVRGCEALLNAPCGYSLQSVFLLHRGVNATPRAVNTVDVLTDTTHAVSCGDDYVCWVWKIKSGEPSQAFFPNEDGSQRLRGPVYTVVALQDAAFILSAGANSPNLTDGGGSYIWDWIQGIQKQSIQCSGGVFRASGEMPVWRESLLGCSDGFSMIWNWNSGMSLQLPYYKISPADIAKAIKKRISGYYTSNLNGWERWSISEKYRAVEISTREDLDNWIRAINPDLASVEEFWRTLHQVLDPPEGYGGVNSMKYVPSDLRFVTGHEDGRVRYWNSDSGRLIRSMNPRAGAIYAVAALPTTQRAVSGGADGIGRLWDLPTGAVTMLMYQPTGGPIRAIAVMPGGKRVAVGSDDGYVRIWNLDSGLLECGFPTGSRVNAIAINPSNPLNQIITAGADGYVRVWNP